MKKLSAIVFLAGAAFSFTPNPALSSLPANTAADLGVYTCNQPVGTSYYCEAITDYSGFKYDKHHHQLLMFGGGHSTNFRDDVDVFNFDSLKWKPAYNSTPCSEMVDSNLDVVKGCWITTNHPYSRHTYDLQVVTDDTKELLELRPTTQNSNLCQQSSYSTYPPGSVAHYNPEAKTWSYGAAMAPLWDKLSSAELDPISGKVILVSETNAGIWTYDAAAKTGAKIISYTGFSGYANNLVYFPPNDKFYQIARGTPTRIWEITLDRATWANSKAVEVTGMTGAPNSQESGWAYDSVNQIIGGGILNGTFYTFDPLTKSWGSKTMSAQSGGAIGTQAFHCLDYDPVNNVFVFITDNASGRHTWAYRYGLSAAAGEIAKAVSRGRLEITVSPNPIVHNTTIKVSGLKAGKSLWVYNLQGKRVDSVPLSLRGTFHEAVWNVKNLPAGVYLLKASDGRVSAVKRVLLQ